MKNLHENLFRPRSRYEKNCGRVRRKGRSRKQSFHNIFERTFAKLKATMQYFCKVCLLADFPDISCTFMKLILYLQ